LEKIPLEKFVNTCLLFLLFFSIISSAFLRFRIIHPAYATTVFSDDFEGADTVWNTSYTTDEIVDLNCTDDPHHGSEHLNATANGVGATEYAYAFKSFTDQTIVYFQSYVKFKTAIPTSISKEEALMIVSVGNIFLAQASIIYNGTGAAWRLMYRNSSTWTGETSTTPANLDTLYNVVLYWKKGSTDGEAALYVNNSTILYETGLDTDDDGDANQIRLGLTWTNLDTTHSIYADCVKVDTSFLGPEPYIAVSDVGVTSTTAGSDATFYTKWETISGDLSHKIFGCNNTGTWQNETSAFPTGLTESWFNQSKILNNTIGVLIQWQVWANNTINEWKTTGLQNLTTTKPPPTISILSPENKTYPTNNIELIFNVNEPTSWMGYSLDGQENVTITGNTTIVGLLDGAHTATLYANDTAGNMGSSDAVYFTVDTVSPNVEILSPQNKTYTTSIIPLDFTVDEATSWIGYSLDGQANETITGNTTLPVLSDGSHNVVVYANDTFGNMGFSDTIYFTVDTVSPNIEILSPENTTYATNAVPLDFTVDEATSWIGYSLDGQANETITGNTTLPVLSDGSHNVVVYANDTFGNMGFSDTIYFTVDTVSPNIEILSPENTTYAADSIPLTFTVDETTSWAGYSLDGQINVTIAGSTTLPFLSDGSHNLVVYANDTAGNMGSSDIIYFTMDTTPPSILIVSPENKTYATINVPFTFMIDESVSWMAYSLDNQANVTITENTTLSGLSDGSHNLVVYANDTANNKGSSNIVYFTIDTVPPNIQILSPENKTYTTDSISVSFIVGEQTSWIGYSLDGQVNMSITGDTILTSIFDGVHFVVVYANDTAGNMGASNTVYFTIDTTPPSVSIVSPENKTYDTADVSLTFTVDESVSWMAYSLDGQANVTITGNTTLSGLSDGSHSIIVYAKDTAGNNGPSETMYFTIETEKEEPFPTWIAPAIVIIIAALGTAVYLLYRKGKSNGKT